MDHLLHFVIDLILVAAGYGIRTICEHRGLFPHPRRDTALTILTSALAAIITVPLVG